MLATGIVSGSAETIDEEQFATARLAAQDMLDETGRTNAIGTPTPLVNVDDELIAVCFVLKQKDT